VEGNVTDLRKAGFLYFSPSTAAHPYQKQQQQQPPQQQK
jgi:hypothetical protein